VPGSAPGVDPAAVRNKNLLTAGLCFAFVGGVFYYSASAVTGGGGEGELEELERTRKINIHQSGEMKVAGGGKR
jgi:hypothetical protein